MTRNLIANGVLRLLGLLLWAAAVLKAVELLTVPSPTQPWWGTRPFLIAQVLAEWALGGWLLLGCARRWAWGLTLLSFLGFCGVTLWEALHGARSCGCFGPVEVHPWITFGAIDVPAVLLLSVFRPNREPAAVRPWQVPLIGLLLVSLVVGLWGLVTHQPAKVTATREVLEPMRWIDQPLPIAERIADDTVTRGRWLLMLFHYDCVDCLEALPLFQQMARDLQGNEDMLRLALVELPPYGYDVDADDSPTLKTRLADSKQWWVVTPAVVLVEDGIVRAAWEPGTLPSFDEVLVALSELMP